MFVITTKRGSRWKGRWLEDIVQPDGQVKRVHRGKVFGTLERLPTKEDANQAMVKWRKENTLTVKAQKSLGLGGAVYFVQGENTRLVKIGFSSVLPRTRMIDLQVGSPDRLILLAKLYGNSATESQLHERFKNDCVRGEWFNPSEELMLFVDLLNPKNTEKSLTITDPTQNELEQVN